MNAALLRFWWVVALGVFVSVLVGVSMVFEIPGFTPRQKVAYTAVARMFVTSAEGQYIRLSVPRQVDSNGSDGGSKGSGGGGPIVVNEPPDVQPLLAAANLYPLLIESDDVAKLRERMFGRLPGSVVATAYTAVSTPVRFLPAQLPIVDIFATSSTPGEATTMAQATADAFKRWVQLGQDRAGVPPRERILIDLVRAPREALPSGGPSYAIPILAALAVAAAFAVLAVVLDQLVPRGKQVIPLQSTETSTISSHRWG